MSVLSWVKGKMFSIGVVLIVAATVFVALFLGTELLEPMSGLAAFAGGFLIAGFVSLFCGFVFTVVFCYTLPEEPETSTEKPHKIRAVLVTVIVLYSVLLVYLLNGELQWTVHATIIDNIAGFELDPSYALYNEFILTSNSLFQATLIIFGILVLPVGLAELGFLDEPKQDDYDEGQTHEGEEAAFEQLLAYLKRRFGSKSRLQKLKKIMDVRSYASHLATVFVIVGSCLIVLPRFLLIDGPRSTYPNTGAEYIKDYMGAARGQLLILGILLVVAAILLVTHFRKKQNS